MTKGIARVLVSEATRDAVGDSVRLARLRLAQGQGQGNAGSSV
jgi:hypothetical protein